MLLTEKMNRGRQRSLPHAAIMILVAHEQDET